MHLFTPLDLYGQEEEMTEVTTSARPIVTAPSLDLMNELAKLRESLCPETAFKYGGCVMVKFFEDMEHWSCTGPC
jgi:hypothetical protein